MRTFKTQKGTELPMLDLKGKDYLQIAWRLVWFREEKPLWSIETDGVCDVSSATFRATIRDESGRIIQVGHGYEDKQGFPDFREKAETKAVGRALAMLGYGTQFAPELEEGERLADSPTQRNPNHSPLPPSMQEAPFDFETVGSGVLPNHAPPKCKCGGLMVKGKKINPSGQVVHFCEMAKKEDFKNPDSHSRNFYA